MKRTREMQACVDSLSAMMFGRTNSDAIADKVCVVCGNGVDVKDFRDTRSLKEYGISGMCQVCQDKVFG